MSHGRELADSAARLLRERMTSDDLRASADGDGLVHGLWAAGREQGWFDVALPERLGGMGIDVASVLPMLKELGRRIAPGPLVESILVLPLCLDASDIAAARALLDHVAGSNRVTLIGLGADQSGRTEDLQVRDGRLRGEGRAVRWASSAEAFLVGARAESEPVLLWVDRGAPGVIVTGSQSHGTCERVEQVRFDNVAVTDVNVLMRGDAVDRVRETVIGPLMRAGLAAELSGTCEALLTMSTDYVMVRRQFDRPIGTFQAIQHLLADAAVTSYALSCLVDAAVEDLHEDPSVLLARSWVLKAVAARSARQVAETALQVHGGIGVTAEHDLHLYLKRVLAVQGLWGDVEDLQVRFAEHILAAAR
jgi:alkylation response protein AidB-like acyl-CoA dehydrogenase